jgi:hypothetical protein
MSYRQPISAGGITGRHVLCGHGSQRQLEGGRCGVPRQQAAAVRTHSVESETKQPV